MRPASVAPATPERGRGLTIEASTPWTTTRLLSGEQSPCISDLGTPHAGGQNWPTFLRSCSRRWLQNSGGADLRRSASMTQSYHALLSRRISEDDAEQIRLDTCRSGVEDLELITAPTFVPERHLESLRRLLTAWCSRSSVGYCQGMHFCASVLLAVMQHRGASTPRVAVMPCAFALSSAEPHGVEMRPLEPSESMESLPQSLQHPESMESLSEPHQRVPEVEAVPTKEDEGSREEMCRDEDSGVEGRGEVSQREESRREESRRADSGREDSGREDSGREDSDRDSPVCHSTLEEGESRHEQLEEGEEEAFWTFVALMELILPSNFLEPPSMLGLQCEVRVLILLLAEAFPMARELPKSARDEFCSIIALTAYKWFVPCFVNQLPLSTLLVTWDRLLLRLPPPSISRSCWPDAAWRGSQGASAALLKMALALLSTSTPALLRLLANQSLHERSEEGLANGYDLTLQAANHTFDAAKLVADARRHELSQEQLLFLRRCFHGRDGNVAPFETSSPSTKRLTAPQRLMLRLLSRQSPPPLRLLKESLFLMPPRPPPFHSCVPLSLPLYYSRLVSGCTLTFFFSSTELMHKIVITRIVQVVLFLLSYFFRMGRAWHAWHD